MLSAAILVVAAGVAAWFFAGRSFRPKTVEAVTASLLTEGQATTLLTATGYVEAERKADLSPKLTSRITELNVTEGSRVKTGDVIARLDHTDLDAQLAERRAAWVNAKAELERQRSLHAQGLAPRASLDAAGRRRRDARRRPYVNALLDYTVIRAPFAGSSPPSARSWGKRSRRSGRPRPEEAPEGDRDLVEFIVSRVGADVNEANLSKLGPNQPAEITSMPCRTRSTTATSGRSCRRRRQKATVRVKVSFHDSTTRSCPTFGARLVHGGADAGKVGPTRSSFRMRRSHRDGKTASSGSSTAPPFNRSRPDRSLRDRSRSSRGSRAGSGSSRRRPPSFATVTVSGWRGILERRCRRREE